MNLPRFALTHRSVVLAFVAVLLATGTFNFSTMPRREDPEITIRDALIVPSWPGAPASRIEELITDAIEDVIAEIPEIDTVKSKSMAGLSVIQATAGDAIDETEQVWDDVRAKVDSVRDRLPTGSGPPFVNSDFGDVYEIVFALHQVPSGQTKQHVYSSRQLEILAERLEEAIELIDSVARVEFWGNRAERIYVEIDSSDWAKLGITAGQLRDAFQARNIVYPGGELDTDQVRYAITPTGEFTSIEQMRGLVIVRTDGNLPVRLGDLPVTVERRYEEPPRSLTRITGSEARHQPAVIARRDGVPTVTVGARVQPGVLANTAAGRVRMRPIVLTTLTTIGGLLPLSLFGGPLWAPMTNGMIFGLVVSTGLTLFVIPSLYVLFAERLGMRVHASSGSYG